ncbi:MAG: plastocyanin/azurin family copper-binding protein [Microthrixaceae bacterium]
MESTKLQRRTVLGMMATTPLVAAACSDTSGETAAGGAEVSAQSVVQAMVPLAKLEDADKDEVHLSYAPEVPPLADRTEPRRFDVHLEVVEDVCPLDPANDVTTEMWGYKIKGDDSTTCGTPGPVVRGRVGDVARITLTNPSSSAHPHNIDFHAVTGQGGGAADLLVAPGKTATIQVRLLYPGAFMYHCAAEDVPHHISMGMYGMFIVDPAEPLDEVDHEWAIMQSEWYVDEPGADGVAVFNRQDVTDENPRYMTFNGRVGALADDNALKMNVGERARIYFVNEGLNLDSNFHPIGSHWDKVYPEAATHPDNHVIRGSQSTLVVAGGGTVTEVLGLVPSTIVLVDHALARTFDKGTLGMIVVDGDPDPEIFSVVDNPSEDGESAAAATATTAAAATTTAPESDGPEATTEVTITEDSFDPANADNAYAPSEIKVKVGDEVTWTNEDAIVHTVTSGSSDGSTGTPDGAFDSGDIAAGETWSHTFAEAGEFDYYCDPHPFMIGKVVVEA